MRKPAHSAKTLETLRQMGCPLTGWAHAPVEWETVRMPVPTRVRCETCHGTGQIADEAARAHAAAASTPQERARLGHAMMRCPTCPPRRQWPSHGSGEVTRMVERDVEVGRIVWPKGTRFDSRFTGHRQCALCAKPITRFVPVLGADADGQPHGMWVGEDCARTLLGVASQGTPLEVAEETARRNQALARAERALWREVPKPPKPAKPAKPALVNPTPKADLDAVVREAFGDAADTNPSYYRSAAELRYYFIVRRGDGSGRGYEVKVSARHGVTVRVSYGPEKPFLKDKDRQNAADALRDALPKLRRDFDAWRASDR